MAEQNERQVLQQAAPSKRDKDAKGVPVHNPTERYKNPVKAEPFAPSGSTGAPGVFSSPTTTASEPPVDPAQTLGRELAEPDNVGESGSGASVDYD
jgi:hypothetical protein